MEKLRDAEGKELTEISKNNLQEFKKILATRSGFYNVEAVTFSEDISFDDIIKDENGKNIDLDDDAQRYLGYCISDNKDMSVEQAKEFADAAINHAFSYPQVIARAYEWSLSGGSRKIHHHIDKVIETKPSDVLPLIDAVVSRDTRSAEGASLHIGHLLRTRRRDGAPLDGTPSGLETLSKEQKRQFEHIWLMASKDRDKREYNHIAYKYELFEELAQMDVFANYDMPREMRADVNKAYLQNAHAINTLDEKYFQTEDVMRIAIMGYDGLKKRPQMVDTSKARTQAEKNVNIIPNHYKKVKKLLLEAVKKEKSYDRTRNEPYTQTEKFQNLYLRYYKERGRDADNAWADLLNDYYNNSGILKDVLLSVAREDIDNGNAAKLNRKILQEVLNEDKEAQYSAKLSNEELSGLKLSPRQEARRKLNYLKDKDYLYWEDGKFHRTRKGDMAKNVYGINQVLFCELLDDPKYYQDLTPQELAALMVMFADVKDDKPRSTFEDDMADVAQKLSPAIDLAKQISKEQAEKKINEEIKMSTNLTGAILKFADTEQDDKEQCLNTWNEIFTELKSKYIIMHEGDLLRVFNSTIDLLRTVTEVSDDPILVQKASLAIDYLKKPPVTDILKYELNIK